MGQGFHLQLKGTMNVQTQCPPLSTSISFPFSSSRAAMEFEADLGCNPGFLPPTQAKVASFQLIPKSQSPNSFFLPDATSTRAPPHFFHPLLTLFQQGSALKYNPTYPPRSGSRSTNIEHVLGLDIFISIRNVNMHSLETLGPPFTVWVCEPAL